MKRKQEFKLTPFEMQVMQIFWRMGPVHIGEVVQQIERRPKPKYTTVQTIVYRLENKQMLRRRKKIGNAHIFEPTITEEQGYGMVVEETLKMFGGEVMNLLLALVETKRLTTADLREVERSLKAKK